MHVVVTDVDTSPPPTPDHPVARITLPRNGDIVSGSRAEFFGTGLPAAGAATVKAEFFIDGTLVYTDVGPGHYHLNGGHTAWDTTLLSDGIHVIRMTVTDDAVPARKGSHEITVTVNNGRTGEAGTKKCGGTGLEWILVLALLALRRWKS
jgi:hypothetical protein